MPHSTTDAATTHDGLLPIRLKAGFGVGNLGVQCIVYATTYYLMIFYTDVVALAPLLVSVALALPRFWDAVSDPLMGA